MLTERSRQLTAIANEKADELTGAGAVAVVLTGSVATGLATPYSAALLSHGEARSVCHWRSLYHGSSRIAIC